MEGTLSDDGPEDLLTDRVEDLLLVVLSQQLVDLWEFLGDGLLQDTEGDGDGLEVFGTSGDVDVDGFQPGIVDDGILHVGRGYFDEGDADVVSLVEDLLLQTSKVVHDEGLLSGVDEIDAVGCGDKPEAAQGEQLTQSACHQSIIFNSGQLHTHI